jgi:acyl-CoA thioester hydrolase
MRFELPEKKKLTFEMTMPIRWGDMDAMGHVNNTLYFRYLEVVRIEWIHRVGGGVNPDGEGIVIVNAFCNFLKQLEYPGDILAKHYVANPGRTSFDTFITLERTDRPGVIYAEGGAKTVWVDFPKQKAVPLPPWLRQLIEDQESNP